MNNTDAETQLKIEPRFPIGHCKGCGKELTGEHKEKANGQTIVYCSYECYCDD